ncbi:MAG: molybdopterin-dependent oxidoreductase [Ignavibacteriaceae bacterium]|nr:molybdopterin-dependent oxidoreductase [Ignavibacteriaceae bacterium]
MKNYDWLQHVRGESLFLDDLTPPEGTLHAAVFSSPIAHGKIISFNLEEAKNSEGVIEVLTAKDIPGENQIGAIIPDEKLLADDIVDFRGQPVAIVIAKDNFSAHQAVKKIKIELEEFSAITDPREAFQKGQLIIPPQIFSLGDVDSVWKNCDVIVEGTAESGGQEHVYLETQGSLAFPVEGGGIKIISSTQSPTAVQRAAARILNLPMNKVEVDVLRLGGGFGGKEDQATAWASMTALAAFKLKLPVKLILNRQEDMRMTGKRHPYSSDFKIGLTKEGKILAYEVYFYQNAGAAADLSTAILDRTLFHCTNSYFIPNVKATAYCCKTNLPPNTAFRGFGGPQGMFVIESAIYKAAEKLRVDASVIQENNLLNEGDEFPYGQKSKYCMARPAWQKAVEKFNLAEMKNEVELFNQKNKLIKKGAALMPICFGISFTNTMLNQASALVHVYTDGSIGISTAAIEMGQGVNMKLRQVASEIFSIDSSKVKIETTNTTRAANTSATAASSGADLNGKAVEIACKNILDRLTMSAQQELKTNETDKIELKNEIIYLNGKPTEFTWNVLVQKTYAKRISLSSQAHYATPNIYFDKAKAKGEPFAYHVYGTAIIHVTVDCLRGTYEIDSVKVVHDFGKSMNPTIDRSQAEGAIMQGIGWMTIEEVIYTKEGKLLTDSMSTYKVPDVYFTPKEIQVDFLENLNPSAAIFNSKAIGEPPLMYGIGIYFALWNAIKAFKPSNEIKISAPMTNEKLLMMLYVYS